MVLESRGHTRENVPPFWSSRLLTLLVTIERRANATHWWSSVTQCSCDTTLRTIQLHQSAPTGRFLQINLKGYPGAETLMKLITLGKVNGISSVEHFFGRGRAGKLFANHVEVIFWGTVSSYAAVMTSSLRKYHSRAMGSTCGSSNRGCGNRNWEGSPPNYDLSRLQDIPLKFIAARFCAKIGSKRYT